jgi:hypothetical protein
MILIAYLLTNPLHGPLHLLPAVVREELGHRLRHGLVVVLLCLAVVVVGGVHLSVAVLHTVHGLLEVPHFLPGKKGVLRALPLAERVRMMLDGHRSVRGGLVLQEDSLFRGTTPRLDRLILLLELLPKGEVDREGPLLIVSLREIKILLSTLSIEP